MMADYGPDIYCVTGFLAHMPVVTGETAFKQALARRLLTPAGSVEYWPDYGTDIRSFFLASSADSEIEYAAENEIEKDDRVDQAEATVVRDNDTVRLSIAVTPSEGGVLDLVLDIDSVTSEVISVS